MYCQFRRSDGVTCNLVRFSAMFTLSQSGPFVITGEGFILIFVLIFTVCSNLKIKSFEAITLQSSRDNKLSAYFNTTH